MSVKTKESGKFQWFLFVILIPLVFAIIVTAVLFQLLDVNAAAPLQNAASKIPVVKELITAKEPAGKSAASNQEDGTQELKKTIEDQKQQLSILESDLKASQEEVNRLNQKIRSMENLEQKSKDESSNSNEANEKREIDKLVAIYESMSGGKAAKILAELNDEEALTLLTKLSNRKLTDILSQMTPEDAARFTTMLSENTEKGGG